MALRLSFCPLAIGRDILCMCPLNHRISILLFHIIHVVVVYLPFYIFLLRLIACVSNMADVASRIQAAKNEIARLNRDIERTLEPLKDTDLAKVAASTPATSSSSPEVADGIHSIRGPPSVKSRRTLKGHFGKITAVQWAADGSKVVSASQDGTLLFWNPLTANKVQSISLKSNYVMSVGMEAKKGNFVACGGLDNLCTVYRLDRPDMALEMASHDGFLSCCRFVTEHSILTASGDSTVLQWDLATARVVSTFAEHTADAMWISIRPGSDQSNTFASCSVDKSIKVWDVRTPQQSVQTFAGYHVDDVNTVEFLPSDGNVLASCSEDGTVRLFDLRAYQQIQQFGVVKEPNVGIPGDGLTCMTVSKSGRLILCGHASGALLAYDALGKTPNNPAWTIPNAHDGHVSCIAASPGGDGIVTGSWDFQLRVWA